MHPDFQKKGLGSRLTRHCNEIADKTGAQTWVVARPSSLHMFETLGYKIVDREDIAMENYGGEKDGGKDWVLVRDPQPV